MILWPWLILVVAYGAAVGSFLNVVIYRLPEGKSIVSPPSSCPKCGHRLAWYDNVPVLGWMWLRARCRYCGLPISIQYPLVEAACGAMFGGLFLAYYCWSGTPFFAAGLADTWPVLVVHLAMIAALFAATVIDARLYIIPLEIPWTISVLALVVLPVAAWFLPDGMDVTPWGDAQELAMALSGLVGLGLALLMLHLGLLPRSFEEDPAAHDAPADGESPAAPPPSSSASPPIAPSAESSPPPATPSPDSPPATSTGAPLPAELHHQADLPAMTVPAAGAHDARSAEPIPLSTDPAAVAAVPPVVTAPEDQTRPEEEFLNYPHARREALKECLFLVFPAAGLIVGWGMSQHTSLAVSTNPGRAAAVLGAVVMGYLVGGACVWVTRVLGTLAFGKEAMGLGDVHLMGAIGAVLGAKIAVVAFFVAPFFGLTYALVSFGAAAIFKGRTRIIPYGPFLAGAAVLMMIFGQKLLQFLNIP